MGSSYFRFRWRNDCMNKLEHENYSRKGGVRIIRNSMVFHVQNHSLKATCFVVVWECFFCDEFHKWRPPGHDTAGDVICCRYRVLCWRKDVQHTQVHPMMYGFCHASFVQICIDGRARQINEKAWRARIRMCTYTLQQRLFSFNGVSQS